MFEKSNKSLQKRFQEFGIGVGISREKIHLSNNRSRLSYVQRGSFLRKSLQKSLKSKKLQSSSQKKFNDYGFNSKSSRHKNQHNPHVLSGARSSHHEILLSKDREISQKKLEMTRKDYLYRRNYQRSQEHQRTLTNRKTAPITNNQSQQILSSKQCQNMKNKLIKNRRYIYKSSQSTQQQSLQNNRFLEEKVRNLQKSLSQYYELYAQSQNNLQQERKKVQQRDKKYEIIKQLYEHKIDILQKYKQNAKKNNFGHLFSYKQAPKTYIPQQIITQLVNQIGSDIQEPLDFNEECCELSLISR